MMRVLIVDNDPSSARLVRESIDSAGASTMEVLRAEDALAVIADEGDPAVAFCECFLPGKGGLWLAERLRRDHPHTALIMTTSRLDVDVAIASLRVGAVDHVLKPFVRARVSEALARAFEAHSHRRAVAAIRREFDEQRREITHAYADLDHAVAMTLEALLVVRHPRDSNLLGRARRVARLAVNLAMALGIREPQLSYIERAVFLRDLGPLPSPDEQRALEILRPIPLLTAACEMALAAHERYDGTGVRGLRGAQIPLGARIIAVAAAYDEIASSASEPAPSRVVEIICKGGASTFDPDALAALRRLQPADPAWPAETDREPVRLVHDASSIRGPAREAAFVEDVRRDPGRRWARKRLAKALPAAIGGKLAVLMDVSYGGLCFELESLDANPADTVKVNVPDLGLLAEATCKWTARRGSGGPYWCGVALSDAETRAGSRWRAAVDAVALPTPLPDMN